MDDTYAKLRAKYERMRAEGSCEVFPAAGPELVDSESLTERAFGVAVCELIFVATLRRPLQASLPANAVVAPG